MLDMATKLCYNKKKNDTLNPMQQNLTMLDGEHKMKNYGYEILCTLYCTLMALTALLMMGV